MKTRPPCGAAWKKIETYLIWLLIALIFKNTSLECDYDQCQVEPKDCSQVKETLFFIYFHFFEFFEKSHQLKPLKSLTSISIKLT